MKGRLNPGPASPEHPDRVFDHRLGNVIEVNQPLVLIAQPNRSGGTLLSQLLDGHPELHCHPRELQIGRAWPDLDLSDSPEAWFDALFERDIRNSFVSGYLNSRPALKLGKEDQLERFPFMLPPAFMRELFLGLAADTAVETQRDVLDIYFTSYFNAWLDNQNLYATPKRWTVVFRGIMRFPENLAGFFRDYPDGRHVTLVREPKAMIASRIRWRGRKPTGLDKYIRGWCRAVEMALEMRERYEGRVLLLSFEDLVGDTEATMHALADWLGIAFDPILTAPTFNGFPIKANSSFQVEAHGVLNQTVENWRGVFDDEHAQTIDAGTAGLYERVGELTASPA